LYFIAFDLVSMVVFSLTTTIRMLLGLIRPTQGGGRILGHDIKRE